MSKRILFRIHGEAAQTRAQDCKEFIKGYFDLWGKRVKLSVDPAPLDGVDVLPYDLHIITSSDETENIAHAAGWSYLQGKQAVA